MKSKNLEYRVKISPYFVKFSKCQKSCENLKNWNILWKSQNLNIFFESFMKISKFGKSCENFHIFCEILNISKILESEVKIWKFENIQKLSIKISKFLKSYYGKVPKINQKRSKQIARALSVCPYLFRQMI